MKKPRSAPDLSNSNPPATEPRTQDSGEALWRDCLLGSLERMDSVGLRSDADDEGIFDILDDAAYQPASELPVDKGPDKKK